MGSLSEAYTFPTYKMGREEANLNRLGPTVQMTEQGKWASVEQPPFSLGSEPLALCI